VNLARILNYVSYVTAGLVLIGSGLIATTVLGVYHEAFTRDLPGQPLPSLTLFALACANSHAVMIFDIIAGLGFSGLLFYLDRSNEKQRAYVPVCLAIPLIISWFQILVFFVAMSLAFVRLVLY
jgi:hypothetical protein